MRIISGKARGTKLYTLEGEETRPTLDRVKESLFNIIQSDIADCIFLDLFAGSGAIGLEAVSRGASKAILCEKSKQAINIIEKNVEKTHTKEKVELYKVDFKNLLEIKLKVIPDIVYIDPPYKTDYAFESVKLLIEKKHIKKHTIIIIETDERERVLAQLEVLPIQVTAQKKYGRVHLIFLQRI